MIVFGITGASGSGKTKLITALLPELRGRGLRVSTIKHAHHGFDMDRPGKDSWQHKAAGAEEVMVVSDDRWALLREAREEGECDLDALLARMAPADVVLVEGFRRSGIPKLEVFRSALGKPPFWPQDGSIAAIATDEPDAIESRRTLRLSDPRSIADFILSEHRP